MCIWSIIICFILHENIIIWTIRKLCSRQWWPDYLLWCSVKRLPCDTQASRCVKLMLEARFLNSSITKARGTTSVWSIFVTSAKSWRYVSLCLLAPRPSIFSFDINFSIPFSRIICHTYLSCLCLNIFISFFVSRTNLRTLSLLIVTHQSCPRNSHNFTTALELN